MISSARATRSATPLFFPDAVLFDLDGTLIDSIGLIVGAFQHATATHLGAPTDRDEILRIIGRSLIGVLEEVAPGRGPELLTTYRAFCFEHHDSRVTLYDGAAAMLDSVKQAGCRVGLVTSKSRASAEPSLRNFDLLSRLEVIVTHDDTERHKPEPDPLFLAAKTLGVAPTRCWYVGDSTHDLSAARAAGMAGIGALWGPYPRRELEPLADALIERPENLAALLETVRDS
jgi:pyrophosphatase PpaX